MEFVTYIGGDFWHGLGSNVGPQLGAWSYFVLAILTLLEGPIATLLAASAAATGLMNPLLVFTAAAAGNLGGDTCWFLLGYLGKMEWLARFGHRWGVRPEHLARLQAGMRTNAPGLMFFAKLSNSLIIPALITAGLTRVGWRRWFPAVLAAEMIWTGSLVAIGYLASTSLQQVEKGAAYLSLLALIPCVLLVMGIIRRTVKVESGLPTANKEVA